MPSMYVYACPDQWGPDEEWEIEVYQFKGTEKPHHVRVIDGVECQVFLCADGWYRAVSLAAVPMMKAGTQF
jgi:hypothetical protein